MKVESFKRFSLETLRCRARVFPVGRATRLVGYFKFTRICVCGACGYGHFVLIWEGRSL